MPRETVAAKRVRAIEIARRMNERYPKAECALHYDGDPFRLVIAVLLSAQTTDKGVNKVTPALWKRYPTPADLASADVTDVEEIIRAIGFYRTKAANCVKCAQLVVSEYGGEVPRDIDELQKLPGVGRKTANVVLNEASFVLRTSLCSSAPRPPRPRKRKPPCSSSTRATYGGRSTINGCSSGVKRASRGGQNARSASLPTCARAAARNNA